MEIGMEVPHAQKLKLELSWDPLDHSWEYTQRNLSQHTTAVSLHCVYWTTVYNSHIIE